MSIKDWPSAERPREKLLKHGPENLSDAELLAIFIQNGTKGKTAIDLARDALKQHQGLKPLLELDEKTFCLLSGLGRARFVKLQAVLELSKRYLEADLQDQGTIKNSLGAEHFLRAKLANRKQEVFAALYLNHANKILHYEELSEGTIDHAAIYPREIIRKVLHNNASAIIVAHNHPSGIPEPSEADKSLTLELKKVLQAIDVTLLDHLVIGARQVVSFAVRGWL